MCSNKCKNNESGFGNATEHCREKHCDEGIFVSLKHGIVYIYFKFHVYNYGVLYKDTVGTPFK